MKKSTIVWLTILTIIMGINYWAILNNKRGIVHLFSKAEYNRKVVEESREAVVFIIQTMMEE